ARARVLALFEKAGDDEVLTQAAEQLHRLRRKAVDLRFGQIPAIVVFCAENIDYDKHADEDERVDGGIDAVLGRTFSEGSKKIFSLRDEIGDDADDAEDDVRDDVGTDRVLGDGERDQAERDEDAADDAGELQQLAH